MSNDAMQRAAEAPRPIIRGNASSELLGMLRSLLTDALAFFDELLASDELITRAALTDLAAGPFEPYF